MRYPKRTEAAPSESPPLFDGYKPDFVLHRLKGIERRSFILLRRLSAGAALESRDYYPKVGLPFPGPGRRPIPSVLSCTAQGLSCPRAYAWGGGLLPRLFTLASSAFTALAFSAEALGE